MEPKRLPELLDLLARHKFVFKKSLGQNFLIEPRVAPRMAAAAALDRSTGVLEIGPGAGALTACLAQNAGHVAALELDSRLVPLLNETLSHYHNKTVLCGDVLKTNLSDICRKYLPFPRAVAMANLPYNITTPAVYALLDAGCFDKIIIMVQKEVVARLTARPRSEALTAFSVIVQLQAAVEPLFEVSSGCFMPRPRVGSAVVSLTPHENRPSSHCLDLVRAGYAQRRKTLVNALSSLPRCNNAAAAIAQTGLSPNVRAEELTLEQWRALSSAE
jgi:16S rRNA (adenine1518-N6/adenine1519-N6)-dimethyltransferase